MASSVFSLLEIESAFQRRLNNKEITPEELANARSLIVEFRRRMALIPLDELAMGIGLGFQKIYHLRPGDSVQLASAALCLPKRSGILFFSLDDKLNDAAEKEGFNLAIA